MSRYRQSFTEALQQVEKWSKDVEVKSTGEHAGKTIDQLKSEVDALRGKSNNEKEMGGLLFAIRAKQGWKKGEGSTGVEEATQIKHERGEVKVDKAERGERKAGESDDDYEDRESGGKRGLRPNPFEKKKKQNDLDRDDEAQATRSKVRPTAEDIVKGISVSKKMAGTTVPPKQAPASQRMDKSKNLMPAPGWKTRKAGNKAGQMTTASYDPENKFRPTAEEHNCDEVHPDVSHKDWIAQQDEDMSLAPKGMGRKAAKKLYRKEGNLPPHLSKFLDKKGNPNKEAQARIDAGKKKRAVATKVKDVTPKGYGPNEDIEMAIMSLDHKEAPRKLKITQKGLDALRAARDKPKVKTQVKITKKGRAAVEGVEIDELSNTTLGSYKAKASAQASAADKKGNFKKADKRFSGITRATNKQFANDAKKEALDTWHPDPAKDRKSTSMKHTAKAVAHHDAEKKKPVIDTRQAAKKIQDILRKQKERKAAQKEEALDLKKIRAQRQAKAAKNMKDVEKVFNKKTKPSKDMKVPPRMDASDRGHFEGVKEGLEFKVTIKGIPPFYVPAKTAAAVKQSLRKQLKHPDDIESIIRVTKAAQKIDYRKRAQGKSDEDDNKK